MPRAIKPIRWTMSQASSEFGIDSKTLAKRIKSKGVMPGDDKKFSTADICRAVFSDGEAARAALAISQKTLVDLKTDLLSNVLCYRSQAAALWDNAIIALRQKVSDRTDLTAEQKQDLLKDLQKIPIDDYIAKNEGRTSVDAAGDLEAA